MCITSEKFFVNEHFSLKCILAFGRVLGTSPTSGIRGLAFGSTLFIFCPVKMAEGSPHFGFARHIVILRVGSEMIRLSWFVNFIFALKTGLEYLQCNYKNVLKLRRRKNMVVDAILMIV